MSCLLSKEIIFANEYGWILLVPIPLKHGIFVLLRKGNCNKTTVKVSKR